MYYYLHPVVFLTKQNMYYSSLIAHTKFLVLKTYYYNTIKKFSFEIQSHSFQNFKSEKKVWQFKHKLTILESILLHCFYLPSIFLSSKILPCMYSFKEISRLFTLSKRLREAHRQIHKYPFDLFATCHGAGRVQFKTTTQTYNLYSHEILSGRLTQHFW